MEDYEKVSDLYLRMFFDDEISTGCDPHPLDLIAQLQSMARELHDWRNGSIVKQLGDDAEVNRTLLRDANAQIGKLKKRVQDLKSENAFFYAIGLDKQKS